MKRVVERNYQVRIEFDDDNVFTDFVRTVSSSAAKSVVVGRAKAIGYLGKIKKTTCVELRG